MRKTTRPQYSAPPIFWRERPGAEVASPSSLGAGAVSEAGKGVLYVYGIDRKVDTSMRVGTCFAQQQQNKVRRGQRTKHSSAFIGDGCLVGAAGLRHDKTPSCCYLAVAACV